MSRKQIWILLGVVVLAALGIGGYYATRDSGSDAVTSAEAATPGFTIIPGDRTLGNPKAKVTLIEYGAPSCPVCAAFNADTFGQVKANYIDTGKVFYVFRVFPIRADDGTAEKIARCLPEDKYFSFIDLAFRNQPKWDVEYSAQNPALASPGGVHDGLVQLGRVMGMSAEQVEACMVNKNEDNRINKVAEDGETRYAITGTPTFILDGRSIGSGNMAYPDMQKLLDSELAKKH